MCGQQPFVYFKNNKANTACKYRNVDYFQFHCSHFALKFPRRSKNEKLIHIWTWLIYFETYLQLSANLNVLGRIKNNSRDNLAYFK